jgi:hypothetical protein
MEARVHVADAQFLGHVPCAGRRPPNAPSGRAAPAARRHAPAAPRTPRPAARTPAPPHRVPATPPRVPPAVRHLRAIPTSTTPPALRIPCFRRFWPRPTNPEARPGSCRKPPGALSVGSGKERDLLAFALWSSAVDGQLPREAVARRVRRPVPPHRSCRSASATPESASPWTSTALSPRVSTATPRTWSPGSSPGPLEPH